MYAVYASITGCVAPSARHAPTAARRGRFAPAPRAEDLGSIEVPRQLENSQHTQNQLVYMK